MSLIAELKRRNVFKVGAAYLALAWVIVQITGTIVPALNLPPVLVPVVVWVGIVGFPCVVLFSWIYELTPEGLKRESEVDRSQSITHLTSRRLDFIIIGLMVVAIALFAFHEFRPSPAADAGADGRAHGALLPEDAGAGHARDNAGTGTQGASAQVSAPQANTIAVLPFADMSQARDQEYFSDGLSEELLNLLAQIPQLQVAGRTSSFSFKGKDKDLKSIGEQLGVATLLEGSVRKSGNQLRITAQLLNAANGFHLWSATYDREMTDIFSVQDEIAGAVVAALKLKLLPEQKIATAQQRATRPEAYNQMLLGRQFFNRGTMDGYRLAVDAYRQAVTLAPDYATAYAGLAFAEFYAADAEPTVEAVAAGQQRAMAAAEQAIALDPQLADGFTARGFLRWDIAGSLADFARALALDPADSTTQQRYSSVLATLGRMPEAIASGRKAIALDPLSAPAWTSLGLVLACSGELAEARTSLLRALEINPESDSARHELGTVTLLQGNAQEALAEYQRTSRGSMWSLYGTALAQHTLGNDTESRRALDALVEMGAVGAAYQIAVVYAWRGDKDQAFAWLERAWAQHDGGVGLIKTDPLLAGLRDDPRYAPMVLEIGLPL